MIKIIFALVAGAFAATAIAQAPAPAGDSDKKAKQEMVKAATSADTRSKGVQAAEGSAKAAATKDAPKALPDKASRRASVTATTT